MSNELMKIGCVNHDCDKCKAQQEPVAWMVEDADGRHFIFRQVKPEVRDGEKLTALYASPQPHKPNATYYGDRIVLPENPNDPLIVIKGGMEGQK